MPLIWNAHGRSCVRGHIDLTETPWPPEVELQDSFVVWTPPNAGEQRGFFLAWKDSSYCEWQLSPIVEGEEKSPFTLKFDGTSLKIGDQKIGVVLSRTNVLCYELSVFLTLTELVVKLDRVYQDPETGSEKTDSWHTWFYLSSSVSSSELYLTTKSIKFRSTLTEAFLYLVTGQGDDPCCPAALPVCDDLVETTSQTGDSLVIGRYKETGDFRLTYTFSAIHYEPDFFFTQITLGDCCVFAVFELQIEESVIVLKGTSCLTGTGISEGFWTVLSSAKIELFGPEGPRDLVWQITGCVTWERFFLGTQTFGRVKVRLKATEVPTGTGSPEEWEVNWSHTGAYSFHANVKSCDFITEAFGDLASLFDSLYYVSHIPPLRTQELGITSCVSCLAGGTGAKSPCIDLKCTLGDPESVPGTRKYAFQVFGLGGLLRDFEGEKLPPYCVWTSPWLPGGCTGDPEEIFWRGIPWVQFFPVGLTEKEVRGLLAQATAVLRPDTLSLWTGTGLPLLTVCHAIGEKNDEIKLPYTFTGTSPPCVGRWEALGYYLPLRYQILLRYSLPVDWCWPDISLFGCAEVLGDPLLLNGHPLPVMVELWYNAYVIDEDPTTPRLFWMKYSSYRVFIKEVDLRHCDELKLGPGDEVYQASGIVYDECFLEDFEEIAQDLGSVDGAEIVIHVEKEE